MNNYPPGVTGNELEIAGPDWEGEIERTCDAENVELPVGGIDFDIAIKDARRTMDLASALSVDRAMVTIAFDECPWTDGQVDAWAFGGVLHWECPLCGQEYEEGR